MAEARRALSGETPRPSAPMAGKKASFHERQGQKGTLIT
jgi:hypothetical protein